MVLDSMQWCCIQVTFNTGDFGLGGGDAPRHPESEIFPPTVRPAAYQGRQCVDAPLQPSASGLPETTGVGLPAAARGRVVSGLHIPRTPHSSKRIPPPCSTQVSDRGTAFSIRLVQVILRHAGTAIRRPVRRKNSTRGAKSVSAERQRESRKPKGVASTPGPQAGCESTVS